MTATRVSDSSLKLASSSTSNLQESVQVIQKSSPSLGMRHLIAQSKEYVANFKQPGQSIEFQGTDDQDGDPELETVSRSYSNEELIQAWEAFISANFDLGIQVSTAIKLAKFDPNVDQSLIRFVFPSETQISYFNDCRKSIAQFFKYKYGIQGLKFETGIVEDSEIKTSFLTHSQKIERWRQENPGIELLFQVFQLRQE